MAVQIFRHYEIIEYVVKIDTDVIKGDPKWAPEKYPGLPATDKEHQRGEVLLAVGRREYSHKAPVQVHTFKDGEPPKQIWINEKT